MGVRARQSLFELEKAQHGALGLVSWFCIEVRLGFGCRGRLRFSSDFGGLLRARSQIKVSGCVHGARQAAVIFF